MKDRRLDIGEDDPVQVLENAALNISG